jgi:hypothetical protein
MEGEMDPFPFMLAEALGKTLIEIDDMSLREYIGWQAFYVWRDAQRELSEKKL